MLTWGFAWPSAPCVPSAGPHSLPAPVGGCDSLVTSSPTQLHLERCLIAFSLSKCIYIHRNFTCEEYFYPGPKVGHIFFLNVVRKQDIIQNKGSGWASRQPTVWLLSRARAGPAPFLQGGDGGASERARVSPQGEGRSADHRVAPGGRASSEGAQG